MNHCANDVPIGNSIHAKRTASELGQVVRTQRQGMNMRQVDLEARRLSLPRPPKYGCNCDKNFYLTVSIFASWPFATRVPRHE
jgi:hypothetical protein